jgi:UDP-N-acetylglucosamine transferase subunit ALG13
MIFVTVGNSIKGVEFHRLIREMDEIARDLKEDVVAQIGYIKDPPRHIRSFRYMNYVEIQTYFQQASMIVSHCGVGTVIHGLAHGKPIILLPRSKAHGEHIDDHQFELAHRLKGMEGIFVVEDVDQLRPTILEVRSLLEKNALAPHFSSERVRLLSFMRNYVQAL